MDRYDDFNSDSSFSDSSTDERRAAQSKPRAKRRDSRLSETENRTPPISFPAQGNILVPCTETGALKQAQASISTLEERLFEKVRSKNSDLFESLEVNCTRGGSGVDRPMEAKASKKAVSLVEDMRRKALSVCVYHDQEIWMHKLREGASDLGLWSNMQQRQTLQSACDAILEVLRYMQA